MTIRALRPYIIAVLMTIPGLALHLAPSDISPLLVTALAGMAILGASFLLTWACEVAQMDMPQAVAVAVVAFIAVLPEYAVDMYFTWMAGQQPDSPYSHYAIANMTGANRLFIGVGWSTIVLIFAGRFHSAVALNSDKRTDVLFLAMATIYALFIPLKGSLTWVDGLVLLGIYVWYILIIMRRPVEEEELEGPAAILGRLAK
ncbi:MAG: sodium:calcium antiporter, partial [Desulfovibrio sp.]|nr:sodium:calcium antiporter [Desulfovibrio sp.]